MKQISLAVIFLTLLGCSKEYQVENKIKEDISFLANDELEGRETGTEGEKKAAKYIAERFKSMGLEEKGTEGYIQKFNFKPKTDPHTEAQFTEVLHSARTLI